MTSNVIHSQIKSIREFSEVQSGGGICNQSTEPAGLEENALTYFNVRSDAAVFFKIRSSPARHTRTKNGEMHWRGTDG